MELSRITTKGQITLPASIRKRLGLEQGQQVAFAVTKDGILVKPVKVDDLTATPDWQKKLGQAFADAEAGRGSTYLNEDEFMTALANNFKPKRKKSK